MSEEYSLEIVNPEKSFLSKNDVTEVVVPAFEGEIGILKDHISIISFLKPGIIVIKNQEEKKYYIEEGTVEFSDNNLLILTSTAKETKDIDKIKINDIIKETEKKMNIEEIKDKEKYILSYKIDTLKKLIN